MIVCNCNGFSDAAAKKYLDDQRDAGEPIPTLSKLYSVLANGKEPEKENCPNPCIARLVTIIKAWKEEQKLLSRQPSSEQTHPQSSPP